MTDVRVLTIRQPWATLLAGWFDGHKCPRCLASFSLPFEMTCANHAPVRTFARLKTIETRTKPTKHRGPVIIRAGLKKAEHTDDAWQALEMEDLVDGARLLPPLAPLQLGAILGVVDLIDCVPIEQCSGYKAHVCVGALGDIRHHTSLNKPDANGRTETDITAELAFGDYTPGQWAWVTANPRPLNTPIPWRPGQLGLTHAPDDMLQLLAERGVTFTDTGVPHIAVD